MRAFRYRHLAVAVAACAVLAACGGTHRAIVVPAPGPTTPGTTPAPGSSMSTAQMVTALQSVETYYETLPHVSVSADLTQVAAHMTATGSFATATIGNGGIAATFADGSPAAIFADKPEDLTGTYDLARTRTTNGARATSASRPAQAWSAVNSHEIAFFVNENPQERGFHPGYVTAFAGAFVADGFTSAAGYGVDVQDVTLDNIVTLGGGYGVDFLDINTHGMVYNGQTLLFSDTGMLDAGSTYQPDVDARLLIPSTWLGDTNKDATYAFTFGYLKKYLHFNAGSIVDVQACFGANASGDAATTLQTAGVGRFLGWTGVVAGNDAYQTDAFLFDRLLGERSPSVTGLDQYASQRTPPQRPFPLERSKA